jgi:hypothetical protein
VVRGMSWNTDGQKICIVYEVHMPLHCLIKPENGCKHAIINNSAGYLIGVSVQHIQSFIVKVCGFQHKTKCHFWLPQILS